MTRDIMRQASQWTPPLIEERVALRGGVLAEKGRAVQRLQGVHCLIFRRICSSFCLNRVRGDERLSPDWRKRNVEIISFMRPVLQV